MAWEQIQHKINASKSTREKKVVQFVLLLPVYDSTYFFLKVGIIVFANVFGENGVKKKKINWLDFDSWLSINVCTLMKNFLRSVKKTFYFG